MEILSALLLWVRDVQWELNYLRCILGSVVLFRLIFKQFGSHFILLVSISSFVTSNVLRISYLLNLLLSSQLNVLSHLLHITFVQGELNLPSISVSYCFLLYFTHIHETRQFTFSKLKFEEIDLLFWRFMPQLTIFFAIISVQGSALHEHCF